MQPGARGLMDSAVHPAAAPKPAVGGVYNGIAFYLRNIISDDLKRHKLSPHNGWFKASTACFIAISSFRIVAFSKKSIPPAQTTFNPHIAGEPDL